MLGPDFTILAAELEVDRREQILLPQREDDLGRRRLMTLVFRLRRIVFVPHPAPPVPPGLTAYLREVRHLPPGAIDDEMQLTVEVVVQRERDGALLVGDEVDGAVRPADPRGDLGRVGDGRRETD